jgi:hypothetical protein
MFATAIAALCAAASSPSATYYVNQNCTNPTPPYSDWTIAATNVQDAIDQSTNNDTILVTNGVYAFGGRSMDGVITNRVSLFNPINVQSVNGPAVTIIQGAWDPTSTNGLLAVRCAWMTNNAILSGFTLTGGATGAYSSPTNQSMMGGGVFGATNASVLNCLIASNYSSYWGGGAYGVSLDHCILRTNVASQQGGGTANASIKNSLLQQNYARGNGGGAYLGTLVNCTIVGNSTSSSGLGGGVANAYLTNCIVSSNLPSSPSFSNYYSCTFRNSASSPLPAGTGNISTDPRLFADGFHLTATSPCIDAGLASVVSGTDLDGHAWSNAPSMGCEEWNLAPVGGVAPTFQFSYSTGALTFNMPLDGQSPFTCFWSMNGVPIQDNGHYANSGTASLIVSNFGVFDNGSYQVIVSNAFGVVTSLVAQVVLVHAVNAGGTNPIPPYSSWSTAATNIQDAINAASAGDVVLVTNGIYAYGGISMDGLITNRVSLNKTILVESVNGAAVTVIRGAWDPTSTNGPLAVRCAWLTNTATLSGFTLTGGATRTFSFQVKPSVEGGGVYGTSTNALVYNCLLITNAASYAGGGAESVLLDHCTLMGNHVFSAAIAGSGGAADTCSMKNCIVISNFADTGSAGGASVCNATNCYFAKNEALQSGAASGYCTLVNCTVVSNGIMPSMNSYVGGAVANSTLVNSIINGNYNPGHGATNYYSSAFTYSDSDPLPAGTGNKDVNPQLLADGIHLSATSPCIGAGNAATTSGTDIDGQPWNNPPSMGCDEWQPEPVVSSPLSYQAGMVAGGLTVNVIAAGKTPFICFWTKDGLPISDDGHHSGSSTANLLVNNFNPSDAGAYQVIVSNSYGMATSRVAQIVIHAVNAFGANPVAPYSSWSTAATSIQDAINASSAGDIVLVTNGVYSTGGKVMAGALTNRVALFIPVTVISVNGYASTEIQGAWDPISTNGPGAVRCAYLADGAVLNGFTIESGATLSAGDQYAGGQLESGGGVYCFSTNGMVYNCVLSNNTAIYGAGFAYGSLYNSLVLNNQAQYGGGSLGAILNNCTVVNNSARLASGGICGGFARNCIDIGNVHTWSGFFEDNYGGPPLQVNPQFLYSDTDPPPGGSGNIDANVQWMDIFHISTGSPCRGAGSALYASGTDLDGEAWANPPSIGCDEVINSNLVGPLSVGFQIYPPNGFLPGRFVVAFGYITGRASYAAWSFGDGTVGTNAGASTQHQWTNPGSYPVTFTVYNSDNPAGVSTNTVIQILPITAPQLQSALLLTNGFQFQFAGQAGANYTIQYATNLVPPVYWNNLQGSYYSFGSMQQITDTNLPTGTRFYRVLAQ